MRANRRRQVLSVDQYREFAQEMCWKNCKVMGNLLNSSQRPALQEIDDDEEVEEDQRKIGQRANLWENLESRERNPSCDEAAFAEELFQLLVGGSKRTDSLETNDSPQTVAYLKFMRGETTYELTGRSDLILAIYLPLDGPSSTASVTVHNYLLRRWRKSHGRWKVELSHDDDLRSILQRSRPQKSEPVIAPGWSYVESLSRLLALGRTSVLSRPFERQEILVVCGKRYQRCSVAEAAFPSFVANFSRFVLRFNAVEDASVETVFFDFSTLLRVQNHVVHFEDGTEIACRAGRKSVWIAKDGLSIPLYVGETEATNEFDLSDRLRELDQKLQSKLCRMDSRS